MYKVFVLGVEVDSRGEFVNDLDVTFETIVDGDEVYGGDELVYMRSDSILITRSVSGTDTVLLDVVLKCGSCLTVDNKRLLSVGHTRIDEVLEFLTPVSVHPLGEKEAADNFDVNAYRVVSLKISKEPNRVDYSENGLLSLRFDEGVLKEAVLVYVFN